MANESDPLDLSTRARLKRLAMRIINTRYFLVALLVHLAFFALVGTKVMFDQIVKPEPMMAETFIKPEPPGMEPQPPVKPPSETKEEIEAARPAIPADQIPRSDIVIKTPSSRELNALPPDRMQKPLFDNRRPKTDGELKERIEMADRKRMEGIAKFLEGVKRGPGTKNDPIAEFTCYVGRYQEGDWNCNLGYIAPPPPDREGKWYGNCMYNLMLQTQRWSKGNIKAKVQPEYLDLADRQWLDVVKPPFIFITGHKDFRFTEAEVDNLRDYLRLGGCLWVDNALPGRKSRFDIALRREMNKVLLDRKFERIENDHPIYHSRHHFNGGAPAGMNFYKEPVEVIKISGDVAVIYTLNAYSDFWETALTGKNDVDTTVDWIPGIPNGNYIYRWGPHWHYNHASGGGYKFFRNLTNESVNTAYRFGVNIVVYLITRFDDKLKHLRRNVSA